ncbi:MAG TPA: cation-transporting P-type ATPase, partial [Desulfobulbus sp.]|nr:cation-transporting P-type ATPase [Desulfobulbus sp.]
MNVEFDKPWHHLTGDTVTTLLKSNLQEGLDPEEALLRLDRYGPNTLRTQPGQSAWMRFLRQFHQPLIYILIAAGGITAALREWVDSGVIFGVVVVNAVIGFIQ